MNTQLCQKCKQAHPGRVCDYNENGECAETVNVNEITITANEGSRDEEDAGSMSRPNWSKPGHKER